MNQINKIHLSNFLTGFVFWYGIEKLFTNSIGISAYQIGTLVAVLTTTTLLLDVPSGMLADRWSRKGTLALSALFLGACAVVLGTSNSFAPYLFGYVLYGLYIVCSEGTYQAIMYDSLYELGKQKLYSRINGKAHALFLCGAGVANITSGFIADQFGLRIPFYISAITAGLNILLIYTMREPTHHKHVADTNIAKQLYTASKAIARTRLLQVLAVVMSLLSVVEYFKSDFGQLYMLRYVESAKVLGFLWAAYAFTWALGSFIAHRLHAKLHLLVVASVLPVLGMAFIDNWFALVLFSLQAVAAAALFNQIETRIQEATPSNVRASVLSVLSSLGRVIAIPASIAIGWSFSRYNAFVTMQFVSIAAGLALVYWAAYSFSVRGAKSKIA